MDCTLRYRAASQTAGCQNRGSAPGPARGRFRGYIALGPGPRGLGLKGPGRVQVSMLSFDIAP